MVDMPVGDTHSFETDLMKFSRTASLEPSLSLHVFLYSHVGEISLPLLVSMSFQKTVHFYQTMLSALRDIAWGSIRVDQRLVSISPANEVVRNSHVPGSQVSANTALYHLNT